MAPVKLKFRLAFLTVLLGACTAGPDLTEQNARLAQQDFSPDYRLAVTTVQVAANTYVSPIVLDPWLLSQQGRIRKALKQVARVDKIDAAMTELANRSMPATAEIFDPEIYGVTLPVEKSGPAREKAIHMARQSGYQGLLFVALQPGMLSEFAGFLDFKIKLKAILQLHDLRISESDSLLISEVRHVTCYGANNIFNANQLGTLFDNCVDSLVRRLEETLSRRLENR